MMMMMMMMVMASKFKYDHAVLMRMVKWFKWWPLRLKGKILRWSYVMIKRLCLHFEVFCTKVNQKWTRPICTQVTPLGLHNTLYWGDHITEKGGLNSSQIQRWFIHLTQDAAFPLVLACPVKKCLRPPDFTVFSQESDLFPSNLRPPHSNRQEVSGENPPLFLRPPPPNIGGCHCHGRFLEQAGIFCPKLPAAVDGRPTKKPNRQ